MIPGLDSTSTPLFERSVKSLRVLVWTDEVLPKLRVELAGSLDDL